MRSATAVELSPTAASWSRMSASRSSSAFPTGTKMVLSRITMSSRNSVAMMGRVRLKSKILPGSPAKEGATRSALVTAASTAGFTALGSSTLLLVRENGSNAKRLVSESHGHVGQCERACGAWGHEILQKNPRFKRYTHRSDRSFRNGGVPRVASHPKPLYPLPRCVRDAEKWQSVASNSIFGTATYPNLATGATTAARARTVLRAAETFAPARKRHWTAEIADIVADR